MEIIKRLQDIPEVFNLSITIGNFDGVHFGHNNILKFVKNKSAESNSKFVVITFIPHPLLLLKPQHNYLVNTYDERRELLDSCGIDYLMEIEFGRDFSNLCPEDFLENFVLGSSHQKELYLGHDFAFGAKKKGDFSFVENYLKGSETNVTLLPRFDFNNKQVSSSIIRKKLSSGDIIGANSLLERKYFVAGTVVKGKERGSSIGFPTANISFENNRIIPSKGVYITKTKIDDKVYHSVTNIGNNPTFESSDLLHVETHILGFDALIYGKVIRVMFCDKLRNERKFDSVNELVEQISIDVVNAKKFFREDDE